MIGPLLARDSGPKIDNLLTLARAAADSSNYEEAYRYFSQVLEVDARNTEAWLGKANAAGWQSTLANIRFNEMFALSERAIATATPEERGRVASRACDQTVFVVSAVWSLAATHYKEHSDPQLPDFQRRLNEELVEWAQQCFSAFDRAISIIEQEKVSEHAIYSLYFSMAKSFFTYKLAPQVQTEVQEKLRRILPEAQKTDPSLQVPEQQSGCFVATAVYGTPHHPDVATLRAFRDDVLAKRVAGRLFIRAYYRLGPRLAELVAGSSRSRRVCRELVIAPILRSIRRRRIR